MGFRKVSSWLLFGWLVLFIVIMIAETIYLHHTGTVYTIDYKDALAWIESWGIYAYIIDIIVFAFIYKKLSEWWQKRKVAESVSESLYE